jgi:cyclophilin family peptidyl-prolyl cis-trans isomerase
VRKDIRKGIGLSSEARWDDEEGMRATLSQSFEGAARPSLAFAVAKRRRGVLALLAGIVLFAFVAGCDSGDARSGLAGSGTDATSPTETNQHPDTTDHATATAAADGREGNFEWPSDPDHPVLELEVGEVRDPDGQVTSGSIRIELMPELAPETVARIQDLAQANYYDGTTFHRVIPGFMIQGGDPKSRDRDPNNDGKGRAEEPVIDEFGDTPFVRGVVGIGHKGRLGTAGNQFFIMHGDDQTLDGRYTAIGRVVSGMNVVDAITRVEIDRTGRWGPKGRPIENVVMKRVAVAGPIGSLEAIIDAANDGVVTGTLAATHSEGNEQDREESLD